MANLYEIDRAILECVDFETGEVIDPDRLDTLHMERNQKIENVALWIKNLESDAKAYAYEKIAFQQRERASLAKAEKLRAWLAEALRGEKFSTPKCAVSFRKSTRLEIAEGADIPDDLMIITTEAKPDANAIKVLLKNGNEISGCRLVEYQNTQIK